MIEKKTKKNNAIELLRFIYSMSVLGFHICKYLFGEPSLKKGIHFSMFPHGALGVEFFFILSGILMASSIDKELRNNDNTNDLPKEEYNFMKKKIKAIFSYHVISFIITYITYIVVNNSGIGKSIKILISSIPSFFLLQMSGLTIHNLNHIEWYISVMLLVMAILYPFVKKYYNNFVKIVCPIIAIMLLGYLQYNYQSITGVMVYNGLFFKSFIRGLAEIMLGLFLYEVSKNLKEKEFNKKKKILLTLVEFILYILSFLMIMLTIPKSYEIMIIFIFSLALPLTFSNITYSSNIFKYKIFAFLGKITLPIYLVQLSAIWIIHKYDLNNGYIISTLDTLVLTFFFVFVVMLIDYLKNKIIIKLKKV